MRIVPSLVLALAAVSGFDAQVVKPFPRGLNGELLFQSDREGPTRMFVVDLAAGSIRRVGNAGDWRDEEPRWSHDGSRIAFSSTRGEKNNLDIFVINADGSGIERVTSHPAAEMGPIWAADDKSLFYTGEQHGGPEIYRVWLADRRVERIIQGRSMMPAASPDGRYLAYAAQTSDYLQIHLLDFTTGQSRQITAGGGACRPSFAPDSQELAFTRIAQEPSRLEAIRESGGRILFDDGKLWSYYPEYSPDGRFLAFSVSPEHHQGEDWDLAVMDLSKSGQFTRVTIGPGNDRVPDWRPRR